MVPRSITKGLTGQLPKPNEDENDGVPRNPNLQLEDTEESDTADVKPVEVKRKELEKMENRRQGEKRQLEESQKGKSLASSKEADNILPEGVL